MIQSSVPSGDLKKPLCPGPNAPFSACIENTGCGDIDQSSAFMGSPPSRKLNKPKAKLSDEKLLDEYTTNSFHCCFKCTCGPSITAPIILYQSYPRFTILTLFP